MAGEDCQAGQRGASSAMAANASNLDGLRTLSPIQNSLECLDEGFGAGRHAEVWPIDVVVLPWRLPAEVKVEAVVRLADARVRGNRVK